MAMLFGALLILGVSPGPQLVDEHPDLFWGVINSMYIGNLHVADPVDPAGGVVRSRSCGSGPRSWRPSPRLITILGVYTINNSVFDIFLMIGVRRHRLPDEEGRLRPRADGVGASCSGSLIESSTRRSMLMFGGDPTGFFTRPLSGTILGIFVVLALLPVVRHLSRRRKSAGVEGACGCCRGAGASRPWRRRDRRR